MKKIAILGTGSVAQIVAEKLVELGYEVTLGTRNVSETLAKPENKMAARPAFKVWMDNNPGIKLSTLSEAAAWGELLINATQGVGSVHALKAAGNNNIKGKVLLDIANPLDFSKGMPPSLTVCNTDSLGETIQREFPDVKVVKGLNTMTAFLMVNPSLVPGNHNVFVCGNDASAKTDVIELLKKMGWNDKSIIDMGDISSSRATEMLLPIWVRLWGKLQTPMFNFNIVVANK
ncbi:MAG: NAD(P)-binding domain-containing protein [Bacteroidales bacterium]|nr:NAD(P)-binding domain-containing protein [Bacteroidales bacterium]